MLFDSPQSVQERLIFIGSGEENSVLLLLPDCTHVVRVSHRQSSTVRRPCRDLANALGVFTPFLSWKMESCVFHGAETLAVLEAMLGKKLSLGNSELAGAVCPSAFLHRPLACWAGIEIKPKWGSRALFSKVTRIRDGADFLLPEKYWTHNKFFLKQIAKGAAISGDSFYDPERLFSNSQKPCDVFRSLVHLALDQEQFPKRNNFSCTESSQQQQQQVGMLRLAAAALSLSGSLQTLLQFQMAGCSSTGDGEFGLPFVLEAPLLLATEELSKDGEATMLEFEPSPFCQNRDSVRVEWNQSLADRMRSRLYNATAARDASVMLSFSECSAELFEAAGDWESLIFVRREDEDSGVFSAQVVGVGQVRVKASVIDLDDKSDYRDVAEIARRDSKLFGS